MIAHWQRKHGRIYRDQAFDPARRFNDPVARLSLGAAIERAGEVRFLPVLLTSVTAIGGLVSSTLLSRGVTPVIYLLLVRGAPVVAAPEPALTA